MLLVLLAQAAAFLPPPPATASSPDPAYRAELVAFADLGEWPRERWQALRPATPAQEATVVALLLEAAPHRVRLAALLAGASPPGSALAHACARAACTVRDEAAALAALLAPARPAPADLGALAYLALEPDRPLALRAAAVARLLDSGCHGAWPVARSMLRSGTAADEDAPWAGWERTGQYELAKRLLLLSVDSWLARHGEEVSGFEPNAAWEDQVEALRRIEPAAARIRAAAAPPAPPEAVAAAAQLLAAGARGDARALRATGLLRPWSAVALADSGVAQEVRARATALAPR